LPGVPGVRTDEKGREVIELGSNQRGMLEELEKAHIYIEELDERLAVKDRQMAEKDQQIAQLKERVGQLEALQERVERLERLLGRAGQSGK
jgi:flagellar motility protein MotE (MotC chaperone)